MPRKKSKAELDHQEQVAKVDLLHTLRAIARDKKTSSATRLQACSMLGAALGIWTPEVITRYIRKRMSIGDLKQKAEAPEQGEDLTQEKEQSNAFLKTFMEERCPDSNSRSTEVKLTVSCGSTTEEDCTSSLTRPLETPCATSQI